MANLKYSLKNQGIELSTLLAVVRSGEVDEGFINQHLKHDNTRKIALKIAGKDVSLTPAEQEYCEVVKDLAGLRSERL